MFDFLKRVQNRSMSISSRANSVMDRDAILQGQIMGVVAAVGCLIGRLTDAERELLGSALKGVLEKGQLGGDPKWLDDRRKQLFKDAAAGIIQSTINTVEQRPTP